MLPVIITMIALFWFSVGGILINEIFEVNSRAVRVIVPLIIIANPLVSVTITYYYCADAYAGSFCLAVVAVWLLTLKNRTKTATGLAILCVTCSLSIYQSSLGVTAGLGTLFGIFQIFQNPAKHKKEYQLYWKTVDGWLYRYCVVLHGLTGCAEHTWVKHDGV